MYDFVDADFGSVDSKAAAAAVDVAAVAAIVDPAVVVMPVDRFVAVDFLVLLWSSAVLSVIRGGFDFEAAFDCLCLVVAVVDPVTN